MCRELRRLEAIKALGFRPTDPSLLVPAFREQCAQLAYVGPRSCKSPWTILRLTLSDDVIGARIIEPINSNLKIRQSRTAPHLKYLYRPTTVEEWWRFIAKLLLKRVKSSGKEPGLSEQEKELVSRLIPDKRYSALKEAHCLNADAIQAFTEALRVNLRRYVALGNFATVDETVIAYYGHDMRVAGIDIKIPRKPHSYGMLRYGLAQRLLYSGAPILIDCESRLPTRRASGPEAFDILVRRNFRISEVDVHIYADSLFCAKGQVANLRRTKARITISFGDNAADDLVKLRSEVVPDLAIGMSRTFSTSKFVAQVTGGKDGPTCVLSTYWRPSAPAPTAPVDPDDYLLARSLFDSASSDSALKELLHIDPAADLGSRAVWLSNHFGVQLWLPLPGPSGVVLTAQNLEELSKPLLLILHNRTEGCSGGSRMKKDDLIKDILRNSPLAQPRQTVQQWQAEQRSLLQVREHVLGIPQHSNTATARYDDNYGLLDRLDHYLYENLRTVGFQTWGSCMVLSTVFQQVVNAHCLFKEQTARRFYPEPIPAHGHPDWPGVTRCAGYIGAVIREIVESQQ